MSAALTVLITVNGPVTSGIECWQRDNWGSLGKPAGSYYTFHVGSGMLSRPGPPSSSPVLRPFGSLVMPCIPQWWATRNASVTLPTQVDHMTATPVGCMLRRMNKNRSKRHLHWEPSTYGKIKALHALFTARQYFYSERRKDGLLCTQFLSARLLVQLSFSAALGINSWRLTWAVYVNNLIVAKQQFNKTTIKKP